jgi:hypothetical protein
VSGGFDVSYCERDYLDRVASDDHQADVRIGVIRVISTIRRSLPVYPDERTFSVRAGMSQTCGHSRMLKHIAEFFAIEKDIRGRSAEERRLIRQQRGRPLADAFQKWLRT